MPAPSTLSPEVAADLIKRLTDAKVFKSTPRGYQLEEFLHSMEAPARAILWEQGVGKTLPVLQTAAHLFNAGKIDFLLVLAPKGVHYNWVDHEIPKHLAVPYRAHAFDNDKDTAKNKRHAAAMEAAVASEPDSLSVLTINYHALLKPTMLDIVRKGKDKGRLTGRLAEIVTGRRVLIVGDELGTIKDPAGQISRRARALSKRCPYKRGLDGTPVDNSPFDLYALMLFLDPDFWDKHGFKSKVSFEHHFGVFRPLNIKLFDSNGRQRMRYDRDLKKMVPLQPETCVEYKNLDQLGKIIRPISTRLTKEQAGLDLPPKVYTYHPFELTPLQRKMYDTMRDEFMFWLDGKLVEAANPLTRILRLQQIASNYIPVDEDGNERVRIDAKRNARLAALVDLTGTLTGQGTIWARFSMDQADIKGALGKSVIHYEGSDSQRKAAVEAWRAGHYQFLLGHTDGGLARGHTLTEGVYGIYYNNGLRYGPRIQSEDRHHRLGQTKVVTYYDIVARDTVDQWITQTLIDKLDVATVVLGDKVREWLK